VIALVTSILKPSNCPLDHTSRLLTVTYKSSNKDSVWSLPYYGGGLVLKLGKSRRAVTEFNKGFAIVVTIIFLAVALYVAGYILPGALTAMATSALTSVNTGVQTLFQIVGSLIAVIAFILLLLGVARNAFTG